MSWCMINDNSHRSVKPHLFANQFAMLFKRRLICNEFNCKYNRKLKFGAVSVVISEIHYQMIPHQYDWGFKQFIRNRNMSRGEYQENADGH